MIFSIGYGDNIEKARKIIEKSIKAEKRILKDKNYDIIVGMLNASSVDLKTRVWVNNNDYWDVYFKFQEEIKNEFDKAGISIPFPQQDVHIYNHKK